jgi:hypothetical protein
MPSADRRPIVRRLGHREDGRPARRTRAGRLWSQETGQLRELPHANANPSYPFWATSPQMHV